MKTAIWWLRRDLRLADNPALLAALSAADRVLPVYLHAPEEDGEWPAGAASRWWLHRSLEALGEELSRRGAGLVVRRTRDSLAALRELIAETGAGGVYWCRLYEPTAFARDSRVEAGLRADGLVARSTPGALLHQPWEVATGAGTPYRLFTPFWRRASARGEPDAPAPAPDRVPAPERPPPSQPLQALELLPRVDWTGGLARAWRPGEVGAWRRLERFIGDALEEYARLRDFPGVDAVSRLSPHLHFGELSPRQVWHTARAAQGERAGPFLRELGWREFAHHVLHHFPTTPSEPLDGRFSAFPWREGHEALLRAWRRAETGFPMVDAGMRELWTTGWMHNRARMIVASLLVKNVRAPWQQGARWFWDTLVDADLANNTLGWQWAGGCGADAAPYFRIFNPVTQGRRFDPDGAYVRRWLPELAPVPDRWLHEPWRMPPVEAERCGVRIGRDYPAPVVDHAESRREALAAFQRIRPARR